MVNTPNEFSWYLVFADRNSTMILWHTVCQKLDDGSVSMMQHRHRISNTNHFTYQLDPMDTMAKSTNLQRHENSFGEFNKCSETPTWGSFYSTRRAPQTSFHVVVNSPDSKVHGANMGSIWDRQGPDGPNEPCYLGRWCCVHPGRFVA